MDKTILITGTTSGIGQSIALYLHNLGYKVIGTYRTSPKDYPFQQIQLDITDQNAVQNTIRSLDTIDVLINNAGIGQSGAIEDMGIEYIKHEFETNFFGTVQLTQAILPKMREQGSGKIINISSMAGLIGMPFQGSYAASKHALEGFTASLRMEVTPFGIQVTNLLPGDFQTDFTKNRTVFSTNQSPYFTAFSKVLAKIETDESNGSNPDKIAKLVAQLILKKRLKPRYLVGSFTEHLLISLRKILPSSLIERMLAQHFNIRI